MVFLGIISSLQLKNNIPNSYDPIIQSGEFTPKHRNDPSSDKGDDDRSEDVEGVVYATVDACHSAPECQQCCDGADEAGGAEG